MPAQSFLRCFAWWGLAAGALLCGLAGTASAHPANVTCKRADVHIILSERSRTDLICRGAEDAIRFMASIGISQRAPVTIRVVSVIPGDYDGSIGSYDWTDKSVYIRGSAALIGRASTLRPFGIENTEALYRSFVAHEVAHAVSAPNFAAATPPITAQEYIAGVVQFAVMDARQRRQILDRTKGDGFDTPFDINLLAYEFDPSRFAAEAYRHFVRQKDRGPDFVRGLLTGAITLQDYIPIY